MGLFGIEKLFSIFIDYQLRHNRRIREIIKEVKNRAPIIETKEVDFMAIVLYEHRSGVKTRSLGMETRYFGLTKAEAS